MRGRFLAIFFFALLMGCSEEDLPSGLYDYQVERLLSGQSGAKNWSQVINSTNCSDSLKIRFELVGDSLDISQLSSCSFTDTTYLGRANASSFQEGKLFTDSLNFSNGDFWIVLHVSSQLLQIGVNSNQLDYRFAD